jgi:hypothetical protein
MGNAFMKKPFIAGVLGTLLWAGAVSQGIGGGRAIPRPLPSHHGNIFLAGEPVAVPAPPAGDGDAWRDLDYEGRIVSTIAEGKISGGPVEFGRLPVGHSELRRHGSAGTMTDIRP